MPTYDYNCPDCGHFEDVCSMAAYTGKAICPICHKETEEREFTVPLSGFVKLSDNELKTLGHLAHRNAERMSQDEKDALHRKHNAYKYETPPKDLPKGMTRMK
jgi:putative FmdB family regulatory protein